MEFEKLQGIIADVLNVDASDITMETTFVDDLEQILWTFSRLSWESRKNSISRLIMMMRKKS